MQEIKLSKELFKKVLSGVKTATTRKGLKKISLGPAVLVHPEDIGKNINITITRLDLSTWRGIILDSSLYHYEGYNASSDLDKALEDIYGEMTPNQPMTVIYFKVIK